MDERGQSWVECGSGDKETEEFKQFFAVHYIIHSTQEALLVSTAYLEDLDTRGRDSEVEYGGWFLPQKHYICIELVGHHGGEMKITYQGFSSLR